MNLTIEQIKRFENHLYEEEKRPATLEKYLRDVRAFCIFADGKEITKDLVIAWKKHLVDGGYAVSSINSMLASMNTVF